MYFSARRDSGRVPLFDRIRLCSQKNATTRNSQLKRGWCAMFPLWVGFCRPTFACDPCFRKWSGRNGSACQSIFVELFAILLSSGNIRDIPISVCATIYWNCNRHILCCLQSSSVSSTLLLLWASIQQSRHLKRILIEQYTTHRIVYFSRLTVAHWTSVPILNTHWLTVLITSYHTKIISKTVKMIGRYHHPGNTEIQLRKWLNWKW